MHKCKKCGNDDNFSEFKSTESRAIKGKDGETKIVTDAVTVARCNFCGTTAADEMEIRHRDNNKRKPYETRMFHWYRHGIDVFAGIPEGKDHIRNMVTGQVWKKSKLRTVRDYGKLASVV